MKKIIFLLLNIHFFHVFAVESPSPVSGAGARATTSKYYALRFPHFEDDKREKKVKEIIHADLRSERSEELRIVTVSYDKLAAVEDYKILKKKISSTFCSKDMDVQFFILSLEQIALTTILNRYVTANMVTLSSYMKRENISPSSLIILGEGFGALVASTIAHQMSYAVENQLLGLYTFGGPALGLLEGMGKFSPHLLRFFYKTTWGINIFYDERMEEAFKRLGLKKQ